jgi:hypothetical protein
LRQGKRVRRSLPEWGRISVDRIEDPALAMIFREKLDHIDR